MHAEVLSASQFVASHLPSEFREQYQQALAECLAQKFAAHWHPSNPMYGSGLRALNVIHGRPDPVLLLAGKNGALSEQAIIDALPKELVIWVDPFNVSYRKGDRGYPITLLDTRTPERPQSTTPSPKAKQATVTISDPYTGRAVHVRHYNSSNQSVVVVG
jgi:protein Tob/BTG